MSQRDLSSFGESFCLWCGKEELSCNFWVPLEQTKEKKPKPSSGCLAAQCLKVALAQLLLPKEAGVAEVAGSHKTSGADRSCRRSLEEHFCSGAAPGSEFLAALAAEKHLQNGEGTRALSVRPSVSPDKE